MKNGSQTRREKRLLTLTESSLELARALALEQGRLRSEAQVRVRELEEEQKRPIPLILTCPSCAKRHIDEGEWATRVHHTHSCQHCGLTWRPSVVATVGVQFLPGFKNEAP